jgi:NAD(P)-dependent dehydrogenase (short-subunit alcohol dehydrogenase family)
VADAFAKAGDALVLLDLKKGDVQEGDKRLFIAANLLEPQSVQAAVDQAIGRFGRIDVLCNLAGAFRMGAPVHETSAGDWDFLLDVNARSLLNTARAVVPRMLASGGGKIVNVGAYAAQKGAANMGAYVASKSAVIRLTEAMAAELRSHNINVNCVLPTTLDTPENRAAMPQADPRRWVAPEDLAEAIAFLASDAARAIHGAALPVTGLS